MSFPVLPDYGHFDISYPVDHKSYFQTAVLMTPLKCKHVKWIATDNKEQRITELFKLEGTLKITYMFSIGRDNTFPR